MFLWVNLQLVNLCKQRSDRDIEQELNSLPYGLDQTYDRILQKIDGQTRSLRTLAQHSILWIVYTQRPLRVKELIDAVAILGNPAGNESLYKYPSEVILEACANLAIEENGFIRPIHYSVQEYFTVPSNNSQIGKDSVWFEKKSLIHKKLANSCMSYLEMMYKSEKPSPHWHDFDERIKQNPFSWYAAAYFHIHIRLAAETEQEFEALGKRPLEWQQPLVGCVYQLHSMPDTIDSDIVFTSFEEKFNNTLAGFEAPSHVSVEEMMGWKTPTLQKLHEIENSVETLEEDFYIEPRDDFYPNPLARAILLENHDLVQEILEKDVTSLNIIHPLYGTPLQMACTSDDEDFINNLLERGADINLKGGLFGTALQALANNRSLALASRRKLVSKLLELGAEVNRVAGRYVWNCFTSSLIQGFDSHCAPPPRLRC